MSFFLHDGEKRLIDKNKRTQKTGVLFQISTENPKCNFGFLTKYLQVSTEKPLNESLRIPKSFYIFNH